MYFFGMVNTMIKTHFKGIQIIKQGKCYKHLMSMSVFLLCKHKIFMVQLDVDDKLCCWVDFLSFHMNIDLHIYYEG